MQARGNAPERASGTARYGLRWHARDKLAQARFWLRRASVPEIMGVFWMICGPVLFLASWASGPLDAGAWVPGPTMFVAGAAMFTVCRVWGWRR